MLQTDFGSYVRQLDLEVLIQDPKGLTGPQGVICGSRPWQPKGAPLSVKPMLAHPSHPAPAMSSQARVGSAISTWTLGCIWIRRGSCITSPTSTRKRGERRLPQLRGATANLKYPEAAGGPVVAITDINRALTGVKGQQGSMRLFLVAAYGEKGCMSRSCTAAATWSCGRFSVCTVRRSAGIMLSFRQGKTRNYNHRY